MATTSVSDITAAVRIKINLKMLTTLRGRLVFAAYAEKGIIDRGHNQLRFLNVPDLAESSTTLADDGTNPAAEKLSLTTIDVTPSEIGRLVSVTRRALNVSPYSLVEKAGDVLSFDALRRVDTIVADAAKAGGTVRFSGTATARSGVSANIVAADVRKWTTKLRSLNALNFDDNTFRAITDPFVINDLMAESGGTSGSWIDSNRYAAPDEIKRGMVGKLFGSTFTDTTQAPVFAAAGSGAVDVYTTHVLGREALGAGTIEGITPTYVPAMPDHGDGLGRTALIGYYMDMGASALQSGTYVRFESAATAL